LGASNFLVKCDAEIIKYHVEKESDTKEAELVKYPAEVRKMERHFRGFTIEHLPRKRNGEADELAKKAAKGEAMPPDVLFEVLTAPSIKPDKQPLIMQLPHSPSSHYHSVPRLRQSQLDHPP
jgi:hypothetical protein